MLRVNDIFAGTVRDLSSEGAGVVEHPDGRVFFVPGVWPGEDGDFRITGLKNRFGFAQPVQLRRVSPHRVTPRCPHHGWRKTECGGCPWQFIDYPAQLEAKETRLRGVLARLGVETALRPIQGSARIYGYRNRAQFKTDGATLGYVGAKSRNLVPIEQCPILSTPNRCHLRHLLASLPDPALKPVGRGHWTSIDIDEDTPPGEASVNRRRPFRQGNGSQNLWMRGWLSDQLAAIPGRGTTLELFAGSGNFTEVIAGAGFAPIVAVDAAGEAIDSLAARALPEVEVRCCDLYAGDAWRKLRRVATTAGVLVLDPPRRGLEDAPGLLAVTQQLCGVIYISCNPATFARDLIVFQRSGFAAREIQPVDLYPHTPHVEVLAHLQRRS